MSGALNTRVPVAQELRHRIYEGNFKRDVVSDIDRREYTRTEESAKRIGCVRRKSYIVYITEFDSVKKASKAVS